MEIFVQLIDALVWPTTVLVISFFFRTELRATLDRLSHLKVRGVEASFREYLRSTEKQLMQLPSSQPPANQADAVPRDQTGTISIASDLIINATAISPRATILESWIETEHAISALAERLPITEAGRRTPQKLMRDFVRRDFVTHEALAAYDGLRTLRNEAAHAADFSLSPEDAEQYKELASELVGYLERIKSDEKPAS